MKRQHLEETCPKTDLRHFRDVDFILLREGNNLYSHHNWCSL